MTPDRTDLARAQLFLDDAWIADSIRLQRVLHQPARRRRPVLEADRPHEESGALAYGTVLRREGRFHLWYVTWTRQSPHAVCYAVSDDGVTFAKPDLGLYAHGGSRANNICLMAEPPGFIDNISVIEDEADPEWPLKAVYFQGGLGDRNGLAAARSKDGLRWDRVPGLVLPGYGDRTNAMAARQDGRYVVLTRIPENPCGCRMVWRLDSGDLVHWSKPEPMVRPDRDDPPWLQAYSATAFRYESLYLGFLERMLARPDRLDSELLFSRDGRAWRRTARREPFLAPGPAGAFDSAWVNLPSNGPIPFQNALWFYYSGRSAAHHAPYALAEGAIGLALLRPDGFASLFAGPQEGWALTPPFEWPPADLLVNADPRRDLAAHPFAADGVVAVEVRDAENRPIPGFARADCLPIPNTVRHPMARAPVAWKDQPGLRALAGRTLRLAFFLRDAHLYSFCAGSHAPERA